jgi:hypothetical protein
LLDCLSAQIAAIEAAIEAALDAHLPMREAAQILRAMRRHLAHDRVDLARFDARTRTAQPTPGRSPRRARPASQAKRNAGRISPDLRRSTSGQTRHVHGRLSAVRYNKPLTAFYQRLIANGKKKLVGITTVMRKLIVICNATSAKPNLQSELMTVPFGRNLLWGFHSRRPICAVITSAPQ